MNSETVYNVFVTICLCFSFLIKFVMHSLEKNTLTILLIFSKSYTKAPPYRFTKIKKCAPRGDARKTPLSMLRHIFHL